MKLHSLSIAALLSLTLSVNAWAQGWQPEVDNLTSGAAASITMYFLCEGPETSPQRAKWVSDLVRERVTVIAQGRGVPFNEVGEYATDATNMKIKALWFANSDRTCTSAPNLRAIATSYGFPVPK